MRFADVYSVPNGCQWRGHVLNVFRLKDGGVIRTLQVAGGNSQAPRPRSPRGCPTNEHSLNKCANASTEPFLSASHGQNPPTECKHQTLVGPRPHSCSRTGQRSAERTKATPGTLHTLNGNMRAKIRKARNHFERMYRIKKENG